MDDPNASGKYERLVAKAEEEALKKASWTWFLISFAIPAALWGFVAFISQSHEQGRDFGFLNVVFALAYPVAGLGAVAFTGIFAYLWLAFITVKTPHQYRPLLHVVGAIALASIVPLIRGDSLSIFSHAATYFKYHGLFVLELGAWGTVVGAIAYSCVKASGQRRFPTYPLRWYALLVLGSAIVGFWLLPEDDVSSPYHSYAHEAYYLGPVLVAFIVFHAVTQLTQEDSASASE